MDISLSRETRIRELEAKAELESKTEEIKKSLVSDLTDLELEQKIKQLKELTSRKACEIAALSDPEFKKIKENFDNSLNNVKMNQINLAHAITLKFKVAQKYDTEITKLERALALLRENRKAEIVVIEKTIENSEKEKPELVETLDLIQSDLTSYCQDKKIAYQAFIEERNSIISPPTFIKRNEEVGRSILDDVDPTFFVDTVRKKWANWKKLLINRGIVVTLDRSGIRGADEVNGVQAKNALKNCQLKALGC